MVNVCNKWIAFYLFFLLLLSLFFNMPGYSWWNAIFYVRKSQESLNDANSVFLWKFVFPKWEEKKLP